MRPALTSIRAAAYAPFFTRRREEGIKAPRGRAEPSRLPFFFAPSREIHFSAALAALTD
jgi:hypothetical protein